ncbi:MAG: Uncharacterized conserved protein GlcG, DUF336 family [Chloroflexi bacterium]|jgi:uncharacterized protein GlcG (DUF336 family)|nr:MAG: Uncharacterized conserved protein GlcG, DUF336 family [Chloroflexota bacterium]
MSITLAASKKALEGAEAKARELGLNITTAVVDTGGVLVGLSRMDGARWMTVHIAVGKAKGSVAYSKPTSELAERAGRPVFQSLMIHEGMLFAQGAVPIYAAGEVVGACGVSGGNTPQEDEDIAIAGAEAAKA